MREEVKTIRKIVLDENEIESLRHVASIRCTGIECCNCPFNDVDDRECLIRLVRKMCNEYGIAFKLL